MAQPIVSWYEGTNTTTSQVTGTVSYGTVDADTTSPIKTFYIWNNRAGSTDVSNMEDVQFTTRDSLGGLGDTAGNIVESVKDNWYQVRVDSLGESTFTPVGKGGVGAINQSGYKSLGTNGQTTNVNASTATTWASGATANLGDYFKPTVANGYIYKVVTAGTLGTTEPTWLTTEGLVTDSGTAQLRAVLIEKAPSANSLLGLANDTLADGSNASLAGGNWSQISVQAEVPITASSGLQSLQFRVSYKFV